MLQAATINTFCKRILPTLNSRWRCLRQIGLRQLDNEETKMTMFDVKQEIMLRMGLESGYQPIPASREHLQEYMPQLEDLPARSMRDSFTSAIIPLSTQLDMQDRYVAFLGHLRLGRLMEDMDLFAVWVCHQYLKVPKLPTGIHLPYTFVTLRVDKVSLSEQRTTASTDIVLSGHVSWVGRSSVEVIVWISQTQPGVKVTVARSIFLMVARNATNTGPAPFNPLQPADEEEQRILEEAKERNNSRRQQQSSSLFKVEPTHYEVTLMHQLYQRTTRADTMELNQRTLPKHCRWMANSFAVNTIASYPENRNAHNTIFGGYIMRMAVETSWASACLFSGTRSKLRHIADISFDRPVQVSSFIKITAYVVYTQVNYMQLLTIVDVLNVEGPSDQTTTNIFYLTFIAPDIVPEVMPQSYHETMWYLQGRRKFMEILALKKL